MFNFIKSMYDRHQLTARQVWAATDGDKPKITKAEALLICGPRPSDQ